MISILSRVKAAAWLGHGHTPCSFQTTQQNVRLPLQNIPEK